MRKVVLVISFVWIAFAGFAQSNAIRNEILNYRDTTVELIDKGRSYLTSKLLKGDKVAVREIKNTLLLAENNKYMAFSPYEIRMLLYWLGDYDELLYFITSFDQKTAESLKTQLKPGQDVLTENLIADVQKNRTKIEKDISEKMGNTENGDFLIMNLHYMLGSKDYPDVTQESLNADADVFLKKHPGSKYDHYTREYIRYKMVKSPWGFGFEMFSGYGLCTGNLNNKFGGNVPFGVDLEIEYKHLTLYLRDYIGIGRTYRDIPVNGTIWPKDTKANTIVPEASIGYALPKMGRLKLSPFAGMGGLDFTPTESQKDEPYYNRVGDLDSFTWIVGLNVDIRLGKTNNVVPIIAYNEQGNWYLRIRYAYVMPQFGTTYTGFEGSMHYLTIGIGVVAHKMKRVY